MTVWYNDGMHKKFGSDEATLATGGSFSTSGSKHQIELKVKGTDVTSTAGTIPGRSVGMTGISIPAGVMLADVELFAERAVTSAGGTATLSVGLKKQDDTELDYDGLLAAVDIDNATDGTGLGTIGNRVFYTQGSTGNGALLGTVTTAAGYLCLNYGTEALTGGVITIKVTYYKPHSTDGSVV